MSSEISQPYFLPIRVYFEDTDAGGIVFYANYLKFMERARTEWLRGLGFEQDDLRDDYGILFVVRSASLEYYKPALFNDQLKVTVEVTELGKSSIVCKQHVLKIQPDADDLLINEADITLVCIDAEKFRPKRIPQTITGKLSAGPVNS